MDWRERITVDAAVCHAQAFLPHLPHCIAADCVCGDSLDIARHLSGRSIES